MLVLSDPSAPAVAVPSGSETKFQHVPVQLTRLPTTVDHDRSTRSFGVNPAAVTSTFVRIWPDVELSCAVALDELSSVAAASVVRWSIVGATVAGHSLRVAGTPASFVIVNFIRWLSVHGTGDCFMFRYGTVWLDPAYS